jgi:tetratricopeptide (TPR) repeat protein
MCLFFPLSLYAEAIVLKSGNRVEGKVAETTDAYVKVYFSGVAMTYFFDEIESINGEPVSHIEYHKSSAPLSLNTETQQALKEGIRYFKRGMDDRAIVKFSKAERINRHISGIYNNRPTPRIVKLYDKRGLTHVHKGDFDSAISGYKKAIDINPAVADYYANRGVSYSKRADFESERLIP